MDEKPPGRVTEGRHPPDGHGTLQPAESGDRLVHPVDPPAPDPALPPLDDPIIASKKPMLAQRPLQQRNLRPRTPPDGILLLALRSYSTIYHLTALTGQARLHSTRTPLRAALSGAKELVSFLKPAWLQKVSESCILADV